MMYYKTTPETYIILLTNVTPINSIKKKRKKSHMEEKSEAQEENMNITQGKWLKECLY